MVTCNKFYNNLKKVSVFTYIQEKESLRLSSHSQSDGFPVTNTQNSKQFNKMFKRSCWSPHKKKEVIDYISYNHMGLKGTVLE